VYKELEKASGRKISEGELSAPPNPELGDLSSTAAFAAAKAEKKNPKQVAEEIAKKIKKPALVSEVKTAGPYVNFFIDYKPFSEAVLRESVAKNYGSSDLGKGKKVMVEFCGVNPNKPHHIGHFRNESLGQAVANIHKCLGYEVITASIVNDKGVPVAKTMLGYEKWKKGEEPDAKPDHFIGRLYADYEAEVEKNPELMKQVQETLQKIQSGDKEALITGKKIWDWFFEGMNETHEREKVSIDRFYLESEIQSKGKEIIRQGLKKGVFKEEEGAIIAPLEKYGLPDKVLQRSDGTAVYATTDLGMAEERFKEYPDLEKNIYCVMNEQEIYFKQWMKSFELMYPQHAGRIYHLAYGMVKSKEGEKMSSRKGAGVLAVDFMDEVAGKAGEIMRKNNPALTDEKNKKISEIVGVGALKFAMLSTEAHKDIHFDIEKILSFEGDTGPYLQYASVRCARILEKAQATGEPDYSALKEPAEKQLVKKIAEFPSIVKKAALDYETHSLAQYLLELAHFFSDFYEKCPVLRAEQGLMGARLEIVKATKNVLGAGLNLLGIETPEMM
jgi:arginyl-tRNA synthetase